VPVLDMKKVNLKQIQNMIKSNGQSIRETRPGKSKDSHDMGDTQLYKNLTQKLIREQQQSKGNQQAKSKDSKFSSFRKNATQLVGTKANRDHSAVSSVTNKGAKSFVFEGAEKQSKRASKKHLNMTGTLQKGLLSPHSGTNKNAKHGEYFGKTEKLNGQLAGGTVININIGSNNCSHASKAGLNKTAKIRRTDSMSSSRSTANRSESRKNAAALGGTKKQVGHHQKTTTLPNAAVLLLNEILHRSQFNQNKISSVQQTPRTAEKLIKSQLNSTQRISKGRQLSFVEQQL